MTPQNDFLGWLAVSLFRQWVAENSTPEVRGILKNSTPQQQQQGPPAAQGQAGAPAAPPPNPNPPAPPPPPAQHPAMTSGRIYRLLGSTNPEAYLGQSDLKRFLKTAADPFGLSSRSSRSSSSNSLYNKENLRRFERRVGEVKNLARDAVRSLTRCCLEGGMGGGGGEEGTGGLGYLVCMRVEEGECPWD